MRNNVKNTVKNQAQYIVLLLPGLLIFTIGLIFPIILDCYYSFTSWNGFTKEVPWSGFANYIKIFTDPFALNAWAFTIKFTIGNTIIQNVFALLFAVIIDNIHFGKAFYRAILFVPCLIAPLVVGFIWTHMYGDVLPSLNSMLHMHINFKLFGSPRTVLTGLLIVNNWQWIGYWMMIYLANLQSIPKELYEASSVDGASFFSQFWYITIPMLAPAFTICIVGITLGSLRVYDLLVSSTEGGPGRASTSIIYYIYTSSISGRQYGYGSALSMSVLLVLLIIAIIQLSILRRREIQL
jgi:ABC-type sugar transport system permease subunit